MRSQRNFQVEVKMAEEKDNNKKILEGLKKLNEAIEDFLDNMDMDCEEKPEKAEKEPEPSKKEGK